MEFQLNVKHIAANEAGLDTFMTYIKDNYSTVVTGAMASSVGLKCQITIVFPTYAEVLTTIQTLKGQFTIEYTFQFNP